MRSWVVYVSVYVLNIAIAIDKAVSSAIRIGGALLFGGLIILAAFFVQRDSYANQPKVEGAIVANTTAERTALAVRDENKNGIPDWEEDLRQIVIDEALLASSTLLASSSEPYTPPTTFTGKFSEAFLQDYLEGKMNGEDFSNPDTLIDNAISAIEQNTKSKRYTRLDFTVVPTTEAGMYIYGNRVGEITILHAQTSGTEDAAEILKQALETKDKKVLEKLEPIRTGYANIIADLLAMEVPSEFADTHVAILNAYEAMLTNTEAMSVAFEDPLYALARVKTYKADALTLYNAFKDTNRLFGEKGIEFVSGDFGSFFYLFDS